jgi:hypothetical protein
MRRLTFLTFVTTAILLAPRAALACPVCFGQNDEPMGNAVKAGVILMLVLVVGVLAGFGAFIIHLNRRARLIADEDIEYKGTV